MAFLTLTTKRTDESIAILGEAGTLGIEERSDTLVAWFPAEADLSGLQSELGGTIATIEPEDWSVEWKKRVRSTCVGPFFVTPPWDAAKAPDGAIVIVIEPEMAFGTGDHATTRGCLALLARVVRTGDRVLDFGCGSGVLGIAAAKLGAREVTAIDCDEIAVETARRNAAVNGAVITALRADRPPAGPFDVIVANIQSSVLEPLLPEIRAALAPGGTMILSGILATEGFNPGNVRSRIVDSEWATYEAGA